MWTFALSHELLQNKEWKLMECWSPKVSRKVENEFYLIAYCFKIPSCVAITNTDQHYNNEEEVQEKDGIEYIIQPSALYTYV